MRPPESMMQISAKAGGKISLTEGSEWATGSDLHVVQAASLPAPPADDEDASGGEAGAKDDEDTGGKGGDEAAEDSGATAQADAKGEFADNDDLEQILLQQSSKVRRSSDAMELTGPTKSA